MAHTATGVEFRVLGALEAHLDGTPARVTAALQREVLAQLLAAQGRWVSDELLVDCLWPEHPPEGALDNLRALVSRLRALLDPGKRGLIAREPGGYRLSRERAVVDDAVLEEALEGGSAGPRSAAQRIDLLERALATWRGEPYAGLSDRGHVAVERARLLALREEVRLQRLAVLLDAGRTSSVLPELERLTVEAPTHERAWELLALARYRAGDQVEALATLRRARSLLLDDHGLDPGPRLRRLEADILAQDPALDLTAPDLPASDVTASDRPAPDRPDASSVGAHAVSSPDGTGGGAGAPPSPALPRPLTSFVGRDGEVAELAALLADHQLVTVAGVGGIGKTRLAIEVAARHGDAYFVDLAAVREADRLADAVAEALGVLPTGGEAGLLAAVGGRDLLLVLDNCEHLVGEVAALVQRVLGAGAGLRALATSRVPLGVEGERVLNLAPLEAGSAGVDLFLQRAGTVGAETSGLRDAALVERICRGLDGVPLALELAAAQCRVLSVHQVADELDEGFELLTTPAAERGEGRSLETVMTWSVERLRPDVRLAFEQFSVFEGGFDLAAARAVHGRGGVVHLLVELLDAGLIVVTDHREGRRYRLLEPLRALARRTASEEVLRGARDAHARWVADLVTAASGELRGQHAAAWFERLDTDLPNVRAGLRHLVDTGACDLARAVAGGMGWFWYRRGQVAEGLARYAEVLAMPVAENDVEARWDLGRCQIGAGMLHYLSGDVPELLALGTAAAASATAAGDAQTAALSTAYLSYFMAYSGDLAGSREAGAQARSLAGSAPDWVLAEVLMVEGQLLRAIGDHEGAADTLQRATAIADQHHHGWAVGSTLWIAAKVAWDRGRPEEALEHATRAAVRQRSDGDVTSWLVSLHVAAGCAAACGRAAEGARLLGAVRARAAQVGFSPEVMDPLDSPRTVSAVRDGLSPDELERETAAGAALGDRELQDLLGSLAGETAALS
ncbi:AfsR/SARP family transcriptional regulator [Nocardioides xinjiangensis]|uniref:AfsR/SARP family transcriptional regulator n=1 Tax=Nocardioides xinjiangensis TaxID=2817376 RepID=UPI001B300D70|nr:BTAD domain-containing putative transcriptional regulator [Nocardioides sp. SYSU D00778]